MSFPRSLLLTWLALLVLVATTAVMAFVPLGSFNVVVALSISVAKTGLVVVLFMKLFDSVPQTRVAAGVGLFWLAILFALTGTDYLTRSVEPVPALSDQIGPASVKGAP